MGYNICIMKKIKRLYNNFNRHLDFIGRWQIAASAASTAFWFFLSLVPIVILILSILPFTSLTEERVLSAVTPIFPESFNALIQVILGDVYASTPGILSVSAIATVWTAGRGFASLIRGLELVYEQRVRSGFLPRRARGIGEILSPIRSRVFPLVLIQPCAALSTKAVFESYHASGDIRHPDTEAALRALADGDLNALRACGGNVLESASIPLRPEIAAAKDALAAAGAAFSQMTGSGSVVFGAFESKETAARAWKALRRRYDACILTETAV